ncbi:MAG: CtpF protein [Candidatus Liberibacter ctenarytainae]|uniref:CtpF protein n=1 Tax=Candidatus Liberibacter ctenarytainae TaxID=2020335 RepID=A0A937AE33_9HYPH|nr:CtpF protein [Candidatus Liberibacter ctenarytainae]
MVVGYESDDRKQSNPILKNTRSLQSISIHAFCITDTLYSVIEKSKIDRRMSGMNFRITKGSISEAIGVFSASSTPNVLIVQTNVNSRAVLQALEPLAEVCDPSTRVVIIGEMNDVALYRELIANGVSDYLVEPLYVEDIISVVDKICAVPKEESFGRSIAFIGSRGGAGSSTIAHNCAFSFASVLATKTVLVDLDLPFGSVNINFDQDPFQNIADVIYDGNKVDEELIDQLLVSYTENLSLLTSPSTLERTYDFEDNVMSPIIEVLQRSFPITILDVPHLWNKWNRDILVSSDKVVITTSLDLVGLRNSKNLIDILRILRPNDKLPYLILNQVGMPKRPEIAVDDFCSPLGIKPSFVVPFDSSVFGAAANSGKMIHELDSKSSIAAIFANFAHILADRVTIDKPKDSIYGKIKSIFRKK